MTLRGPTCWSDLLSCRNQSRLPSQTGLESIPLRSRRAFVRQEIGLMHTTLTAGITLDCQTKTGLNLPRFRNRFKFHEHKLGYTIHKANNAPLSRKTLNCRKSHLTSEFTTKSALQLGLPFDAEITNARSPNRC